MGNRVPHTGLSLHIYWLSHSPNSKTKFYSLSPSTQKQAHSGDHGSFRLVDFKGPFQHLERLVDSFYKFDPEGRGINQFNRVYCLRHFPNILLIVHLDIWLYKDEIGKGTCKI